jgi:uncharacterized protein
MVTMEEIQTLVDEIASGYKPEKIYLFGSYANGEPNYDSDIDLFIVKDTDKRKIERSFEVRMGIKNYINAMDIIVYTPQELETAMGYFHNIGKIAVKTGKLMYERV